MSSLVFSVSSITPLLESLKDVASTYHRPLIVIGHLHMNLGSRQTGSRFVPSENTWGLVHSSPLLSISLSNSLLLAHLIKPDASALRPLAGTCLQQPIYSSPFHQIPRNGCYSSCLCAEQPLQRSSLLTTLSQCSGHLGQRLSWPGSGGWAPSQVVDPPLCNVDDVDPSVIAQNNDRSLVAVAYQVARAECLSNHQPTQPTPACETRPAPALKTSRRGPVPGPHRVWNVP